MINPSNISSARPAIQKKIYTFGYGNRKNCQALLSYCREKNITLLVDVRKSPKGWAVIWGKGYLEKHLPTHHVKYLSLPTLGNISGNQNWVPENEVAAQEAMMQLAELSNHHTILLMCSELNPAQCHRSAVAEKLSKKINIPVEHLL